MPYLFQRQLKKAVVQNNYAAPSAVNIVMDTTYFGRSFGITVFYDSISKKPLYVEEVKYETNAPYQQTIRSF